MFLESEDFNHWDLPRIFFPWKCVFQILSGKFPLVLQLPTSKALLPGHWHLHAASTVWSVPLSDLSVFLPFSDVSTTLWALGQDHLWFISVFDTELAGGAVGPNLRFVSFSMWYSQSAISCGLSAEVHCMQSWGKARPPPSHLAPPLRFLGIIPQLFPLFLNPSPLWGLSCTSVGKLGTAPPSHFLEPILTSTSIQSTKILRVWGSFTVESKEQLQVYSATSPSPAFQKKKKRNLVLLKVFQPLFETSWLSVYSKTLWYLLLLGKNNALYSKYWFILLKVWFSMDYESRWPKPGAAHPIQSWG